jgi:hypothetical protein
LIDELDAGKTTPLGRDVAAVGEPVNAPAQEMLGSHPAVAGSAKDGEARVDRKVLRDCVCELALAEEAFTGATGGLVPPLVEPVPLPVPVPLGVPAPADLLGVAADAALSPEPSLDVAAEASVALTGTLSEHALNSEMPVDVAAIFRNSRRVVASPVMIYPSRGKASQSAMIASYRLCASRDDR